VVVVLRTPPIPGGRLEEGLRVTVGLTISNPRVSVLLLDEAVQIVLDDPSGQGSTDQLAKHWSTLSELGVRILVDRERLEGLGASPLTLGEHMGIVSLEDTAALLAAADAVLVY
jgi:hypothetical protein